MINKVKLFQKLTLENLMLHESTEVDLTKELLTLITGANGSGKTQILDGLIICLGHIPSRAKVNGISSLVGKNGDFAKVTLVLANPVINGRRAFYTIDKDLNVIINFDTFKITAKIDKEDSTIAYSINDSRKVVRGRVITKGDIRRIFESTGVRGDNKLAFTGEGTVDEFAAKSPKRKLDVLLEVTGLKEYREEIIAAQEILKASIQEIEPLKRKYEAESKLLNIWNEAIKILNQKKQLLLMKARLETELVWSHVTRLEKQLNDVNQERLKIIKQKSENEQAIKKKEEEIVLLDKKLNLLNDQLQSTDELERQKNKQIITLETQINFEEENIKQLKIEIERYQNQQNELQKILANKKLTEKDKLLQNKQEVLIIKTKKLSMIQEKLSGAESKLLQLRNKITLEPDFASYGSEDEIYSGNRLTKYEEDLMNSSKIFLHNIKKQNLLGEITGPLISHIKIKENEREWELAVKNLIGRNLYVFIAKSDESYKLAKQLYDKIWPQWKPAFAVFKVTEEDAEYSNTLLPKPSFKEIHDLAVNLIIGDPYVVGFLKRVVKGATAEDKFDPNSLTNIARELHTNIITKSGKSFYLAQGGFSRPPAPMKNALGWKIKIPDEQSEILDENKIRITIAQLEKEIRDFKMDEIKTLNELSKLQYEIQALGTPDEKLLGKIETINEIVTVVDEKINDCTNHKKALQIDLINYNDNFGSYALTKSNIKNELKDYQEKLELLRIDLHVLKEKSSRLLTLEINFDSEYESIIQEKKEREVAANEKGKRPLEIRNYTDIKDELNRVEGHLDSISISNVDEEKIEAQRVKVESLSQYMKEREEHIANLRSDLESRLAYWSGELQEIITNITKSMQLLLGGIFERVKINVAPINKPEEAGLYIEAITKGQSYRDFRELSGGEKVLAIEGLILALHTLTDSPIHAIDEFTQRLDEKNKALAFSVALRTQKLAGENSRFVPQFILLCPDALNIDLSESIYHMVVSEMKVIKAEQTR